MKLTPYSRNRILATFQQWDVPKDFAGPMYAYLVHGFGPGGCFTAVLANDFLSAVSRSHLANTFEEFLEQADGCGAEFYYIMKDGVWYVGTTYENTHPLSKRLTLLSEALESVKETA